MMDNFKIVTVTELEDLYRKSRVELGELGIGQKVIFSMLSGDSSFVSICAHVVAYKEPTEGPSFPLTLAFPLITETTDFFTKIDVPFYMVMEDVIVAAMIGDGADEVADEPELPMVGHFPNISKLVELINYANQFENSVAARRSKFRVV